MIKRIPDEEPETDESTELTSQDELDELKKPCEPYKWLVPDNTPESASICGDAIFKDSITIFVTMIDGKILTITIGRRASVAQLKAVIENMEGMPARLMRLICSASELKDSWSLVDYEIRSGTMVHMGL